MELSIKLFAHDAAHAKKLYGEVLEVALKNGSHVVEVVMPTEREFGDMSNLPVDLDRRV